MKRKTTFIIITIVVIFAIMITTTHAQIHYSQKNLTTENTNKIIEIANQSMNKANQTINYATSLDINPIIIHEAKAIFSKGETYLNLALATIKNQSPAPTETWGNHTTAKQLALEAMHQFKNTITKLAGYWNNETSQIELFRQLNSSINRTNFYLNEIETIINNLKEDTANYNFTKINNQLLQAKQHLQYAQTNLTLYKINSTKTELNITSRYIKQINSEIKDLQQSTIKEERITQFIDNSIEELIVYQDLAQDLGIDVYTQADEIETKLNDAKTLALSGDLENSMKILREAGIMLETLASNIKGEI
jgi:hypothetical protein